MTVKVVFKDEFNEAEAKKKVTAILNNLILKIDKGTFSGLIIISSGKEAALIPYKPSAQNIMTARDSIDKFMEALLHK